MTTQRHRSSSQRSRLSSFVGAFVFYRQLLFTTFDRSWRGVYGVPSQWVETGFALALAATIVASMNIVGVTLIAAAIVIPPSTARLLTH